MLTVISGPMKLGKTKQLLKMARRYMPKRRVFFGKPSIDTRDGGVIHTHDGDSEPCMLITDVEVLRTLDYDVYALDEMNLAPPSIVSVILELVERDKIVLVAGVPLLHNGKPFGPMPELLANANRIIRVSGTCWICKNRQAVMTIREGLHTDDIVIGAEDYTPTCRVCWKKHQGGTYAQTQPALPSST